MELGLKLVKIHRVMRFRQSTFLKKYIDFCIEKRKNSDTKFEQLFWKLYINAIFGKFCEQVRNYLNCKFALTEKALTRYVSSPKFSNFQIINEDLVIVFQKLASVTLNKAYAIGFTILERSKEFMYNAFYKEIRPLLGKVDVMFSDTDSLCLECTTDFPTDSLKLLGDMIDYSNYPTAHPLHCDLNKNKLGLFKDELKGSTLVELVGLRSKTYSLKIKPYHAPNECKINEEFTIKSTAKGVRAGYKKTIPFSEFKRCIETVARVNVTQYHIQSKLHCLSTNRVQKCAWTSFDDKRYLFECGIHSTPYGSSLINNDNICPYCELE